MSDNYPPGYSEVYPEENPKDIIKRNLKRDNDMPTYKNVSMYAANDGKPHLCRVTLKGNEIHIEWLDESPPVEAAGVRDNGWFLKVLEENYEACKDLAEEDKKRSAQDIINETYEDLISIYKHKLSTLPQPDSGYWKQRCEAAEKIHIDTNDINPAYTVKEVHRAMDEYAQQCCQEKDKEISDLSRKAMSLETTNVFQQAIIDELREGLEKIEQMSDPGLPERGIVYMKGIASSLLSKIKQIGHT